MFLLLAGCAASTDERIELAWYTADVECENGRATLDLPAEDVVTIYYRQTTIAGDDERINWTTVTTTDDDSDGGSVTAICGSDVTFTYAVVTDDE